MMDIPGWEKIPSWQVIDNPGAQHVGREWYRPAQGCDSLQTVLKDLYLDALLTIWLHHSYLATVKGVVKRRGVISDARMAGRILTEFGILDEAGEVVEGDRNEVLA